MLLAEVEVGKLLEVVWVSLLAGVGISMVFSLVIYAGARGGEARRDQRPAAAAVFFGLSALGFAAFLLGVVYGVSIMLSK